MIISITKNDLEIINELENNFQKLFFSHRILDDLRNNPYSNYIVYIVNTHVVAFINYYLIYERAEIINFNVLEEFQNNHIGSKLLETTLKLLKESGVKSITLEVKCDNKKALYLYKKYGFKQIDVRKKYYNGIDGNLMEKEMI